MSPSWDIQPNTYTDIYLKLGENYVQNGQLTETTTSLQEVVVTAGLRNSILSSERSGTQTNVSGRDLVNMPYHQQEYRRLHQVHSAGTGQLFRRS
ncbi:MAG: hypothetical protein MZV63_50510 [Marinilabiliales bacterium]|nr:hypothetical protein [Marinilabiliales bacterium]